MWLVSLYSVFVSMRTSSMIYLSGTIFMAILCSYYRLNFWFYVQFRLIKQSKIKLCFVSFRSFFIMKFPLAEMILFFRSTTAGQLIQSWQSVCTQCSRYILLMMCNVLAGNFLSSKKLYIGFIVTFQRHIELDFE